MADIQAEIQSELDINERLLNFGALSVGDVLTDLNRASDYVASVAVANDAEAEVRTIVIGQLHGEIGLLTTKYDYNAPLDPEQWPRERAVIERAYAFTNTNMIELEEHAGELQARADVLNKIVDKAGDAGKDLGKGLEGVLSLVVTLVVVLLVVQIAGKA
jgi:hypothetical protein